MAGPPFRKAVKPSLFVPVFRDRVLGEPSRFHGADDTGKPIGIRVRRIELPRAIQFFHRFCQFLPPQGRRSIPQRDHGKTFSPVGRIYCPLPVEACGLLFRLARQHLTGQNPFFCRQHRHGEKKQKKQSRRFLREFTVLK